VPIFHTFHNIVLPFRSSTEEVVNSQVSCHLDCFLNQGWLYQATEQWVVAEAVGGHGFNERNFIREAKD